MLVAAFPVTFSNMSYGNNPSVPATSINTLSPSPVKELQATFSENARIGCFLWTAYDFTWLEWLGYSCLATYDLVCFGEPIFGATIPGAIAVIVGWGADKASSRGDMLYLLLLQYRAQVRL